MWTQECLCLCDTGQRSGTQRQEGASHPMPVFCRIAYLCICICICVFVFEYLCDTAQGSGTQQQEGRSQLSSSTRPLPHCVFLAQLGPSCDDARMLGNDFMHTIETLNGDLNTTGASLKWFQN